jgi:hypothetical protein
LVIRFSPKEHPLVCVVDDAQWLDRASAQVLAFAARRLLAESVVLLFGVRESDARAVAVGGSGATPASERLNLCAP